MPGGPSVIEPQAWDEGARRQGLHHSGFDEARGKCGIRHHQKLDLERHPEKAQATHRKLRAKDRPLVNDFITRSAGGTMVVMRRCRHSEVPADYRRAMRPVFDALDRLDLRYFVTGSVAASVYGVLRQTHDTDVVLDLDAVGFDRLASGLRDRYAIADPIEYGEFAMASVIDQETADKVDLILRRAGPFETSAFERRRQVEVLGIGIVWVASVEDLVLAKLAWSEGTSELQLRDCEQLLRLNATAIDQTYLERWAARLGLAERLRDVLDAT